MHRIGTQHARRSLPPHKESCRHQKALGEAPQGEVKLLPVELVECLTAEFWSFCLNLRMWSQSSYSVNRVVVDVRKYV